MTGLLLGVLIFICLTFIGRSIVLRLFKNLGDDESVALGAGLGLMILSNAAALLGLLHLLTPSILWALAGVVLVAGGTVIASGNDCHPERSEGSRDPSAFGLRMTLRVRLLRPASGLPRNDVSAPIFLSSLTLLLAFLCLRVPDISNDSLCYHLHLPKLFLWQHSIALIPFEFNSHFPLFMEMLYTFALGLGHASLASFFHFACGITAAFGIYIFSRRFAARNASLMAALIFITTPGILFEMTTAYVDIGLSCYTVLAAYALWRGIETGESRWLALAGLFASALLGIKYLGLLSLLSLSPLLGRFLFSKEKQTSRVRSLLYFILPLILLSAAWYLRAWWTYGSPVYPFFYSLFGVGKPDLHYDDIGLIKNFYNLALVPWFLTMHPEKFEGFGVQLGPAYLALLPFIFLGTKPFRKLKWPAFVVGIYTVCWFFLAQSLRFYFPILGLLAVLLASGLETALARPLLKKFILILSSGILIVHLIITAYHYRRQLPVALGLVSQEEYLSRHERSYGVARFINQNLADSDKIMAADEAHLFFFERPIVRETTYALRTKYSANIQTPEAVINLLKKDNFTHVLRVTPDSSITYEKLPPLSLPRLLESKENPLAPYLEEIYTTTFISPEERQTEYILYKIK